jgi:hypothetical protein
VPPEVVTAIEPLVKALQVALLRVGFNKIGELQLDPHGVNCTVVVNVEVHEFASVTVTV